MLFCKEFQVQISLSVRASVRECECTRVRVWESASVSVEVFVCVRMWEWMRMCWFSCAFCIYWHHLLAHTHTHAQTTHTKTHQQISPSHPLFTNLHTHFLAHSHTLMHAHDKCERHATMSSWVCKFRADSNPFFNGVPLLLLLPESLSFISFPTSFCFIRQFVAAC